MKRNMSSFRLFSPDENASNRLQDVYDASQKTWLAAYKLLRISSVGSLAGVLVALGVALLTADRYAVYGLLGVALLIILRHRPNIRRLLARQEG